MKIRKIIMMVAMLTMVGVASADNLLVSNVEMKAGETKQITIELNNPDNKYAGFQFDLVLPEGITIAKNNKNKFIAAIDEDRVDDHTLTVSDIGNNTYRFLAFSMTNAELYETSGALVNLTLKADENITSGVKTASIVEQVFTQVSGDQVKWDKISFSITIPAAVVPEITAENKSREYGEDNPQFTYTASSELNGQPELTTTATNESPVGDYEIVVGRGTVVGDYTSKNGILTITKAPLTVKAESYTIKQGDALPEFAVTYSGFKNGEDETVLTKKPTLSTSATSASAPGDYDILVSGATAQNYEISYTAGKLIVTEADPVTITAKSYTRKYGEANPVFEFTTEGAELEGTPEISCSATETSPVGTYPITVTKGTVANYNVTYVAGTLTIEQAPLTIAAGTYTKKQGEALPEFTLNYTGFKNGETESVLTTQPVVTCDATAASAPGEYAVTVSGATAQNYEISYTAGKLIVTEADPVTITAKSYTRKYGEANPVFEFTTEGAELEGTPEISCSATETSPVGTYPITVTKGTVANYNVTYVAGTLTVEQAPLTISVGNYTRVQGEENPIFSLIYEGFKNGEDESVLLTLPTVTTIADVNSPAGEYAIIASGAEAQNYEISYVNGTLVITPATGIDAVKNNSVGSDAWYDISGRKLPSMPIQKGIYILNGKKLVIK